MNSPPPAEAKVTRRKCSAAFSSSDFDLVVADTSWTWTDRLFSPLASLGPQLLTFKACDWRTAWNQRRAAEEWFRPLVQRAPNHWERSFVLPPGWMKTYPSLGMRPFNRAVGSWRALRKSNRPLVLAISYPHYLYLRDMLQPDALLYYNMDDYALYWAGREDTVRRLERRAVVEADLTVFCARVRADEWRSAAPEARDHIIHLPHGAPAASIAASPQDRPAAPPSDLAHLPRPLLGFVGSLEDRLDWTLIEAVARRFPEGSIILIGREPSRSGEPWYHEFARAAALPNVHVVGWREQGELARYNASFDVCMIPYRGDHPFNRVACPTKIMDYMATSRPVVSTALPECRLYSDFFEIAETSEVFLEAIRRILDSGSDDGRATRRWECARNATWDQTAARLLESLLARLS
jgi:glycosyltransferase involved in cell wall biosynthesis